MGVSNADMEFGDLRIIGLSFSLVNQILRIIVN
jgi:hypothetical protein